METIPTNITASAVHPTASPTTVGLAPPADDRPKDESAVVAVADTVAVAARENREESESLQRICSGYATIHALGEPVCVPTVRWSAMRETTQTFVGAVIVFWHAHHGPQVINIEAPGHRYSLRISRELVQCLQPELLPTVATWLLWTYSGQQNITVSPDSGVKYSAGGPKQVWYDCGQTAGE